MRVNLKPPLLAVALNKPTSLPRHPENQTFSVNFPGANLMEKADYCGLVSGHKVDKSGLFRVFYGELETAPLIEECPLAWSAVSIKWWNCRPTISSSARSWRRMPMRTASPTAAPISSRSIPGAHHADNNYWTVGPHAGQAMGGRKEIEKAVIRGQKFGA